MHYDDTDALLLCLKILIIIRTIMDISGAQGAYQKKRRKKKIRTDGEESGTRY